MHFLSKVKDNCNITGIDRKKITDYIKKTQTIKLDCSILAGYIEIPFKLLVIKIISCLSSNAVHNALQIKPDEH